MNTPTPRSRPDLDPQRLLAAHHLANEFYRSHLLDEPRALAYLSSLGIIAATAHAAPWGRKFEHVPTLFTQAQVVTGSWPFQ